MSISVSDTGTVCIFTTGWAPIIKIFSNMSSKNRYKFLNRNYLKGTRKMPLWSTWWGCWVQQLCRDNQYTISGLHCIKTHERLGREQQTTITPLIIFGYPLCVLIIYVNKDIGEEDDFLGGTKGWLVKWIFSTIPFWYLLKISPSSLMFLLTYIIRSQCVIKDQEVLVVNFILIKYTLIIYWSREIVVVLYQAINQNFKLSANSLTVLLLYMLWSLRCAS